MLLLLILSSRNIFALPVGLHPQAYKFHACSASRPKKEPRVSNRDISGLMDVGGVGELMHLSKVLEQLPTVCVHNEQDTVVVFVPEEERRLPYRRN